MPLVKKPKKNLGLKVGDIMVNTLLVKYPIDQLTNPIGIIDQKVVDQQGGPLKRKIN